MPKGAAIPRRTFLIAGAAVGGGLLVGVRLLTPRGGGEEDGVAAVQRGPDAQEATLHAFVEIALDDTVTITAPCPEIGQGVRTSLAQIVAEELDADWSTVRVRQSEANARYGGQVVGGSDSARDYWEPLRRAGAVAREMLRTAAAEAWGVPAEECLTEQGVVAHSASGRRATYGSLARAAARLPAPAGLALREPADFRIIGEPLAGIDVHAIITGTAEYGLDVRVPGMLRAVVARAPVHGARVATFDATEALAVPGVITVTELEPAVPGGDLYAAVRGGVAVVAEHSWSAIRGREALTVDWELGEHRTETSGRVAERLLNAVRSPATHVLRERGDPERAFATAARVLEAEYELPILAHACMEPVNCTAHAEQDACRVWGPVQNPQRLQQAIARQLRLPLSAVRVHPMLAGGGFGRRLAVDYGVEAAMLSRQVGAPVQVLWTREDDIRHDYYRPPSAHRLRAVLELDGRVSAWEHHLATPSLLTNIEAGGGGGTHPAIYDAQGAADAPLDIANLRVSYTPVPVGLQMGSWRSVANSFNSFAVNCFLDEIAAATGGDPLETMKAVLGAPRIEEITLPLPGRRGRPRPDVARILRVLDIAAERAGWGSPLPRGSGRGIAWAEYKGSYAAHVAEVSFDHEGALTVSRIVAVLDCGRVINPSGARAQLEGACMDGVATFLHWGIRLEEGRVVQGNFHDYPLVRIGESPKVESHLIESDEPPAGAGEPPYPSVAPAIANAAFHASGRRIRRLPMRSA